MKLQNKVEFNIESSFTDKLNLNFIFEYRKHKFIMNSQPSRKGIHPITFQFRGGLPNAKRGTRPNSPSKYMQKEGIC